MGKTEEVFRYSDFPQERCGTNRPYQA